MASFIYNPYSKEEKESQYKKYLQTQSFVNQLEDEAANTGNLLEKVINICSSDIKNSIENSSIELGKVIQSSLDVVCFSLDSGFYSLGDKLINLENQIGYGMYRIVENIKITNSYLGNIQQLLKIPDNQKQRVYYIEEGLKYLINASKEKSDSDFYTDALEEFTKAREIEKKDFLSLYYIGFIHLISEKNINFIEAETCFKNSARYCLAESIVGGTNFTNNLLPSINFLKEAALAYFYAGEACWLQGKFSEAVSLADKAYDTDNSLLKAKFVKAKYLVADNKLNEAIPVLKSLLLKDCKFALDVAADSELISEPAVQSLLEELREETVNYVQKKLTICRETILPNSAAKTDILLIESYLSGGRYLESKAAEKYLFQSHYWVLENGVSTSESNEILPILSMTGFNGNVMDFVKIERDNFLKIPIAEKLIEIKNIESLLLQEEAKLLKMKNKDAMDAPPYWEFNCCFIGALISLPIAYLANPYGDHYPIVYLFLLLCRWVFIVATIGFTFAFLRSGIYIFRYERSINIQRDSIDALQAKITQLNIQLSKLK